MFEDPVFVEPGANDFRLERTSPAIDAGAYLPQAGAVDLGEEPRLADGLPDIGAHELPTAPPSPTPVLPEPVISVADLPWRAESSRWGPVERDLSSGEKAAGDGQPHPDRGPGVRLGDRGSRPLGGGARPRWGLLCLRRRRWRGRRGPVSRVPCGSRSGAAASDSQARRGRGLAALAG